MAAAPAALVEYTSSAIEDSVELVGSELEKHFAIIFPEVDGGQSLVDWDCSVYLGLVRFVEHGGTILTDF